MITLYDGTGVVTRATVVCMRCVEDRSQFGGSTTPEQGPHRSAAEA